MTTVVMVTTGNIPMVKFTYALNSMGTIIMVEAKPKCVKILVRHTTEVATKVVPTEG